MSKKGFSLPILRFSQARKIGFLKPIKKDAPEDAPYNE